MAPQLTPEQNDALNAHPGKVVYFVDAQSEKEYAVIPAEIFERVRALLDPQEVLDAREFYPAVDQSWQPIIDDSAMDVYEQDVPLTSQP